MLSLYFQIGGCISLLAHKHVQKTKGGEIADFGPPPASTGKIKGLLCVADGPVGARALLIVSCMSGHVTT